MFRLLSFKFNNKSIIPTSYIRNFAKTATKGKKEARAKAAAGSSDKSEFKDDDETLEGQDQRAFEELLPKMEESVNWDLFVKSMEAPAIDKRSKFEKDRHDEILKVYTKNTTKRMIQEEAFLNQIIDEQYSAIAALPKNLRELALEFDVILPPPHPRIGVPREFPTLPEVRTDIVRPSEEEELEAAMLDEAARNNTPIQTIRDHIAKEKIQEEEDKKIADAAKAAKEADKKAKLKKEKEIEKQKERELLNKKL